VIHVRFDLIYGAGSEGLHKRTICRLDVPEGELPDMLRPGSTINLNGYPYVMKSVGWAAHDEEHDPEDANKLYAFVEVVKLYQWGVKTPYEVETGEPDPILSDKSIQEMIDRVVGNDDIIRILAGEIRRLRNLMTGAKP